MHAITMGWLSKYPRLTAGMVSANPPHSIATAKGHLNQTRQVKHKQQQRAPLIRGRSTLAGVTPSPVGDHPIPVADPTDDDPDLCIKMVDLAECREPVHADLTGCFPVDSSAGNKYVLVACWHNYIHFEPMPSRKASDYVAAYSRVLQFFRKLGRQPCIIRLDNETSTLLEAFFTTEKIDVQFVPPGTHRALKAERGIQTGKNHLISVLCGADPEFPLHLWDETLFQAELTLNHLRPYALDPSKCAYDGLHSQRYDFVAHPIAPVGTLVVVHDKPAERQTWPPHGVKGYYLGPAVRHYHC
jgi:hypothetical protein